MSHHHDAQPTVPRVEIHKFMGPWYVVANIPTRIEAGAHNIVEAYEWNERDKRIEIDFRFNKDAPDGPLMRIPQCGFIHNHETNAEWRVQPLWPFKFAYMIVDLAPDYSDAVIGDPDRKHVWIMSRRPAMDPLRYEQLVEKIRTLGYRTSALQRVPHAH